MTQHKSKIVLALTSCFILLALLSVYFMSGTLATPLSDYAESFSDPYTTAYNAQISVGETVTRTVAGAYSWANTDSSVLTLTATQGAITATVTGVKPGVSTISVGSSVGQIVTLRYKVVDNTNITAYTVTGGVEGHIAAKNGTLSIPIVTTPAGSANKITWVSLNASVATVSGATVTAVADDGAAIILGKFTDPWGLVHSIPFLVVVGDGSGGGNGLIKGPDNQWYRPVGRPPHVYEKVNEDGSSQQPPAYVYSPDGVPGNDEDRPAYLDGGSFWVEDPSGSNIWKKVHDDNGTLIQDPAKWGGPDGKLGGGDDKTARKFGDDYWVDMGQNVWRKVDKNNPTGPLGPLTGGGPDGDPSTSPVTPIYDNTANDGKYYVGPLGPDEGGNMYYYGDPIIGGNGALDSTASSREQDDVKYYKDANGNMTTAAPPATNVNVGLTPATATYAVGDQELHFNATVTGNNLQNGTGNNAVIWSLDKSSGATISDSGAFTASAGGVYTITATSKDDPTKKATATVTVNSNIRNTPDSGIVTIDGIEWIKLRSTYSSPNTYAVLMLKGTIGPWSYGPGNSTNLQYKESTIKTNVNTWYNNLTSPTLKSMVVEADIGVAPAQSWPASGSGYKAHLPRKADVQNLTPLLRIIADRDYWLANPAESQGAWTFQETVKSSGEYGIKANDQSIYARPIVWVLVP